MTQHSQTRLLFMGECMVELKEHKDGCIRQSFAGDSYNSAVYCRRLLPLDQFGIEYFSALGDDNFSLAMRRCWQEEGLGSQLTRTMPGRQPGLYFIHVDENGERSFSYWRQHAAARSMLEGESAEGLLAHLQPFDVLYLSGISLAILPDDDLQRLLTALERYEGRVIFDNNYRPKLWASKTKAQQTYRALLPFCDLALLTWDDEKALFDFQDIEQSREQCAALGVNEIVFKRGSDACLIYTASDRFEIPAQKVDQVVDTTAAGDSFSAGYLSARLLGHNPQVAAKWGHLLAASVIQHEGGIIAQNAMPLFE